MLTNLDWLSPGAEFPPKSELPRLKRYEENNRLFLTEHCEVWQEKFRTFAARYKKKNWNVDTVINYHQLLSKKTADFVCGKPPTIETEGDTDALMQLLDRQRFPAKLYESFIDVSRFGNGVIKFVRKGISVVSLLTWYPVVYPDDLKTISHQVIAYPQAFDTSGNPTELYAEIHTPGKIEQRRYQYSAKDHKIGRLLADPATANTGLNDFAVVILTNLTHSGDICGIDDYVIINSLIRKIMWRLHCADTILDKHSDPSVSGPESALRYDEQSGMWFVPLGNYFKRANKDDPDMHYITWDGNLDSNFKELEMLFDQLYILTEMGQAFNDAGGTVDASGTALKLRMVSPRIKAQRLACLNSAPVKSIIATLAQLNGVKINYNTLNTKWNDGLPEDEVEKINTLVTATGNKAVMSQYAALKERGLSDADVQAELKQMAEERASSVPVSLGIIDPNADKPTDAEGGGDA